MIHGIPGLKPARAIDPCRRPEGSWALGTRMNNKNAATLNMNVYSTQAMLNALEKCDVLEKAIQLSIHDQHDVVVKIKYGKEFRSRCANSMYVNQ